VDGDFERVGDFDFAGDLEELLVGEDFLSGDLPLGEGDLAFTSFFPFFFLSGEGDLLSSLSTNSLPLSIVSSSFFVLFIFLSGDGDPFRLEPVVFAISYFLLTITRNPALNLRLKKFTVAKVIQSPAKSKSPTRSKSPSTSSSPSKKAKKGRKKAPLTKKKKSTKKSTSPAKPKKSTKKASPSGKKKMSSAELAAEEAKLFLDKEKKKEKKRGASPKKKKKSPTRKKGSKSPTRVQPNRRVKN